MRIPFKKSSTKFIEVHVFWTFGLLFNKGSVDFIHMFLAIDLKHMLHVSKLKKNSGQELKSQNSQKVKELSLGIGWITLNIWHVFYTLN